MLPVTALGIALGYAARGWIAANRAVVVAIYVAIWLAVYTLYVVRIGL